MVNSPGLVPFPLQQKAIVPEVVQESLNYNRLLAGLAISGAAGMLLPVALLGMPKPLKLLSMVGGVACFSAGAILSQERPDRVALAAGKAKAVNLLQKEEVSREFVAQQMAQRIDADWLLAERIMSDAPPGTAAFYLIQAELGHLVPYYFPEQQAHQNSQSGAMAPASPHSLVEQSIAGPIAGNGLQPPSFSRVDVDTSWLTPDFARRSKFIAAGRGSGKSTYLHWEAQTIAQCKEAEDQLIIIDPHVIGAQIEAAEKAGLPPGSRIPVWGLFETPEEEAAFIIHTEKQSERILRSVYKEAEDRIKGISTNRYAINVIVEESDDPFFTDPKNSANGAALVECFRYVVNSARKAKINMTLIAHTLKKGRTGLDSSDIEQISWLLMGSIAGAANIRFPTDFDTSRWGAERTQLQSNLSDDVGRAVILREEHEGKADVRVVVMPPPNSLA